MYDGEKLKER